MFSVDGVALDSAVRDWRVMRATVRHADLSRDRPSMRVAGRDGVVAGLAATVDAGTVRLVVECPTSSAEALVALVGDAGTLAVVGDSSKEVAYETLAAIPRDLDTYTARMEVSFTLRLPAAFWRAKATTEYSVALSAASVTLDTFPGISATVADALVRLQGQGGGVTVTDSSGAWVTFPDASAGQWLRFDSATGKCYRMTSASWSGGTDISGQVDFGGPRGVFEITPKMASGDPTSRSGALTITSASRVGAVVAVRGKSAQVF